MSVVKVVEIISESSKSWEDAAQSAVAEVARTVRNVRHVWVEGLQCLVGEDNRITRYRLNAKVSFVVDEKRD